MNATRATGRTPAHATGEGNTTPKILTLFAENGADFKARDYDAETPLEIARRNGRK